MATLSDDKTHIEYDNLEELRAAAKSAGLSVRKTTVTKYNEYYQVIYRGKDKAGNVIGGIVGFFNTASGTAGPPPDDGKPYRVREPFGHIRKDWLEHGQRIIADKQSRAENQA